MHRSSLYEQQRRMGARFALYHDWEIAEDFGDPRREYEAVRAAAGALDVSYIGKLRVTGRDRGKYLHNMLSNDIQGLSPGRGCYATLLTHQGHMEADVYVYAFTDEIWLECPPSATERALASLNKYIISDVVTLEDRSLHMGIFSLQGRSSRELMEQIVGASLEGLVDLNHRVVEHADGNWVVARRDRTGCDGYDLWLPTSDLEPIWLDFAASGRTPAVGHLALNWLRTEAGIPWYGAEMDDRTLPMEMGLDRAISTTKGCYRGQEIVARVLHRGHLNRKLGGIALEGDALPLKGAEVRAGGSRIGEVRSAIHSPRLGKPLALALIKLEFLKAGVPVEVTLNEGSRAGNVVELPIDPPPAS